MYTDKNGINYFVPISHQNVNDKIANFGAEIQKYCIKIEYQGEDCGCLDFRYSVPCFEHRIHPHEITPSNNTDKISFSTKQALFCLDNKTLIQKTAKATLS